jgi:hypothetical protein
MLHCDNIASPPTGVPHVDIILLSILGTLCILLIGISDLPRRERAWHYARALVGRS